MLHSKFIITNGGHLRLGRVTLHRDLLMGHEECLGGGSYDIDHLSNRLILSGKSFDYGPPRWNKVSTLLVPEAYRAMTIIYRDNWDEELDLASIVRIEYY